MTTRLGLDMGTNSIGWCLYHGDSIRDIGVRIFSDGRDPKSGASLAVDRRDARAMRRRRDRYIGRRSALFDALIKHGLMPDDDKAAKALEVEDPYELRAKALDEKLTPHQLGRALFHLNQRRGFKSNRKADRKADDKEGGKIAGGTKALDVALDGRTLGQYLHGLERKRVRMRPDDGEYDFYPDRKHYEDEFARIWAAQTSYHPALLTDEAREAIYRIIFFQRPLKEQVVGTCTFAGINGVPADEERLPKAHPLFQERRMYEEVNQLRICVAGEKDRPLTMVQREALIAKLRSSKEVSFASLGKAIKLGEGERFNKESENRKGLLGDEIRAALGNKKCFDSRWAHFSTDEQWTILERLIEEEKPDVLHAWLKDSYSLDDAAADAVAKARLPEGYGRFGITATRALLEQLKADVCTYAQAAERAGFHHSDFRTGECFDELPYYGKILAREIAPGKEDYSDALERQWGKITNPTVHIGLNQLRKLINAVIRVHGCPDEIVVELARELKLNEKQKKDHNRQIKENTDAAKARGKFLEGIDQRDTGANRLLVRLWNELSPTNVLDHRCPYCGEPISATMLLNGSVDIDHIIPYSKSFDDSVSNKVVVHTHCNREKGNNTPWGRWGGTERWLDIQDQVARLHKSKQWRFAPDAMERVERDGGFIARQLTDTQYLARMARTYLSALYPKVGEGSGRVYVIPGRMTAMLRRLWGLNELLPDHNYVENPHSNAPKNRLDHRHHAIDAAVVGITTRGMLNEISRAAARAEDQNLDKLFADLPHPWENFRDDLRDALGGITVSHKSDHGRTGKPAKGKDVTAARLHNDTAYGLTGATNASGAPIVVHRIPLMSVQPKDLTNPDRMTDKELQYALYAATEGLTGKDFEKALTAFSKKPGPFQGVRRVRVREALNVIAFKDKQGKPYKAYLGDSNTRYNVWRMPGGEWVHDVISTFDSHQRGFVEKRPHPAAKKIMSLTQNDLLAVEREDGIRKIMRVQKFGQNGQIFLIDHNETGNMSQRDKDPNDPFKFYGPGVNSLKKMKTRQIRIDELGRIFDPGPRE